ncbi:hypothetical protein H9P43_000984 [Blastocladiella emersonii ATCC 22665]|nr:hypothetical protein H9P43_000984 [Blastocladiella emersonii ATCC 22665]
MTTTVKFGPFLAAEDVSVVAKAVVGPKGTVKLAELAQVAAAAPFSALDASVTEPLQLKENGASSVSVWHKTDAGLQQITFAEFDNSKSRNMAVLRTDTLRDTVASAVPAKGDAQLTLIVASAAEAYAAGLAAARNWPIFTKKTGTKAADRTVCVDFVVSNGEEVNYAELQAVAEAIRNTQRLVDSPCDVINTDTYIAEVHRVVAELKEHAEVTVEIIRGEELRDRGFGGLWGVGKAAEFPPALVILTRKAAAEDAKTVALVGKGIVYDCGGLSLKPTTGMSGMKSDMGGSAAVLGAFQAIVTTGAAKDTTVHALLCLAENAIDAKSYKNDDILHMYSGKTVEINNTDAEGRLVLADGVAYASRHLAPTVIADIATLTGAQLIATGKLHAGVMTNSDDVESRIITAGKATGDLVFPMLYAPEYLKKQFDSPVADMKNSVADRMNAQSSAAGHFIEAHLDAEYKGDYLHIDIAGPSEDAKTRGTGHGVALLYHFVKNF